MHRLISICFIALFGCIGCGPTGDASKARLPPKHPITGSSTVRASDVWPAEEQQRWELVEKCSHGWVGDIAEMCQKAFGADLAKLQDEIEAEHPAYICQLDEDCVKKGGSELDCISPQGCILIKSLLKKK